jgi:Fur family transcriptional regulator, ferric uptake regulator
MSHLESRLTDKNIKPTAMRLLVLDYLSQQNKAISLNDIESSMEKSDRITLYRTLKTFEEKSIIHSIYDGTGVTKYALCEEGCNCVYSQDLHVHFFCNSCKDTFCLPKSRVPAVPLPDFFKAEEASLLVKGTCKNCSVK